MGKLIDGKGKLFGKISVVDLGILLLVIAVLAGAYLRFVVGIGVGQAETHTIQYTVEVRGIRHWSVDNVRANDAIFIDGTAVGTVVKTWSEPYVATIVSEGRIWEAVVPDRYILHVVVESPAVVRDGRFFAGGTEAIAVSNNLTGFTTKFADFSGAVSEIVIIHE